MPLVSHTSHLDDSLNTLSAVARKYGKPVPVVVEPGDIVYFHSHLLHRSHVNAGGRTGKQSRRAFVAHYCNARSFVPWNGGSVHRPFTGAAANGEHILARGNSHLPYAQPRFGTPCAATELGPSTAPRL